MLLPLVKVPGCGATLLAALEPSEDIVCVHEIRFYRVPPKILPKRLAQSAYAGSWIVQSGDRGGGERDRVAEVFEAAHMMALKPGGIEAVKVVRTQVEVGFVVTQHVVDADQDAVGHRNNRLVLAPTAGNVVIAGDEVVARRARNRPRHLP